MIQNRGIERLSAAFLLTLTAIALIYPVLFLNIEGGAFGNIPLAAALVLPFALANVLFNARFTAVLAPLLCAPLMFLIMGYSGFYMYGLLNEPYRSTIVLGFLGFAIILALPLTLLAFFVKRPAIYTQVDLLVAGVAIVLYAASWVP